MASKQLSSVDLYFVLKELKALEGSRIDKIRQPEKNTLIITFYKSNVGKSTLQINLGKSMFLAHEKEVGQETLGFGMFLRKKLDGRFLEQIEQIIPERIVRLTFASKTQKLFFYLEFFGGGNAILCANDGLIIDSLERHEFRGRSIRPKIKYENPKTKYDLYNLDIEKISDLLKISNKQSIITCLAVELGLGGVYSEEICILENIDKNKDPKSIATNEAKSILASINSLLSRKISAQVVFENENPIDALPFALKYYEKSTSKDFESFSQAQEFLHLNQKKTIESEIDKRMRGLKRIIGEQQAAIEILIQEEQDLRYKGELVYHKYAIVKDVLEQINKASSKLSWKEINERLSSHETIKKIDAKDKTIEVEL